MTMTEALRISREIYSAGGPVEDALKAKCNWEHMTRSAVIMEWGDPRLWLKNDGPPEGEE